MLEDVTRRTFLQLCPESWIKKIHLSDNIVEMRNGAEVLFRSGQDAEPLFGLNLGWYGCDEIGLYKEEVFRELWKRVRNKDESQHRFVVGNPAGPAHWTFKYFVQKAKQYPHAYHLTRATSFENTFLGKSYVEGMAITFDPNSAYYKRYVLGEFVAAEGAYWTSFDSRPIEDGGHVFTIEQVDTLFPPTKPRRFGMVIDFGFEHYFVCLFYVTDGQRIGFFDEYRAQHGLLSTHKQAIKVKREEHTHRFRFMPALFAYTDHDAQVRAELANELDTTLAIACVPADKSDVMEGILLVQSLFGVNRVFVGTRCEQTLIEVPSYASNPKLIAKEGPVKENDDTCDCIRYACVAEMQSAGEFIRYNAPRDDSTEFKERALELIGSQSD